MCFSCMFHLPLQFFEQVRKSLCRLARRVPYVQKCSQAICHFSRTDPFNVRDVQCRLVLERAGLLLHVLEMVYAAKHAKPDCPAFTSFPAAFCSGSLRTKRIIELQLKLVKYFIRRGRVRCTYSVRKGIETVIVSEYIEPRQVICLARQAVSPFNNLLYSSVIQGFLQVPAFRD